MINCSDYMYIIYIIILFHINTYFSHINNDYHKLLIMIIVLIYHQHTIHNMVIYNRSWLSGNLYTIIYVQ